MPSTGYLQLNINNQDVDLGDISQLGVKINYTLEYPESWQNKQSSDVQNVSIPATKQNDQVFNTFHDISIEDLTPGQIYRNLMPFYLQSNGVVVLRGKARLNSATYKEKPEAYNIGLEGGNGDWLLSGQNLTLWDCVSDTPHTFDVETIENSWKPATFGGYDSDEDHDYVYAPVRYRQPFQYTDTSGSQKGNDDTVSIYMLRPSISKYWLIIRAFRAMGYTVNSNFFNTQYFRRQVMPWTWGDFFDISNQVTAGLSFKAVGASPANPPGGYVEWATGFPIYFGGGGSGEPTLDVDCSGWLPWGPTVPPATGGVPGATGYVQSLIETNGGTNLYHNFRLNNTLPPDGFDNFGLYSFDESTGTMQYNLNIPAALVSLIGSNITMVFQLNLFAQTKINPGGNHTKIIIEISKNGVFVADEEFTELTAVSGVDKEFLLFPVAHNFTVSGLNNGDVVTFRLKYDIDTDGGAIPSGAIIILSSLRENVNPVVTGASNWQYDKNTNRWDNILGGISAPVWQPMFSSLTMTGIQIELGGSVNFKYYDNFRNHKFFDFLSGIVDEFDLEIQTNPLTKTVTIEPFAAVTLPDYDPSGVYTGDINLQGYFDTTKVVDWTEKQDLNKTNEVKLFADSERQIDFVMKQDGSDGGQNIYAARYKGIYLNNVKRNTITNQQINNGIIAGVPGSSRYMLPNRFAKGNKQHSNRFFSPTLHYKHEPWANLTGTGSPAPQLICIMPENINDSSANAITQTFEPKSAFWAGLKDPASYGRWRWIGDPASPYDPATAVSFPLPFMFSVNYGFGGGTDPVLTYCDQNIGGDVIPGLMRKFFLRRMAVMRNGQLLNAHFRLNLDDICRFEHQECISIKGKGLFALINIENYNPLSDESCMCTMWKLVSAEETDIENSFPSADSVENSPASLPRYDLRYAPLMLYYSDIPQV